MAMTRFVSPNIQSAVKALQPPFDLEKAAPHVYQIAQGLILLAPLMQDRALLPDWKIEDLPCSMQRLVLYEGDISIALHHLVVNDFLVHNHRRPFLSYCVAGGYRYRIFSERGNNNSNMPTSTTHSRWWCCERETGGVFSPPIETQQVPELLLDTYFNQGNLYLIEPRAFHQVDQIKGEQTTGPVTLVIKPRGEDSNKSVFYFCDPEHSPLGRPASGRSKRDLETGERAEILKVFSLAVGKCKVPPPHQRFQATLAPGIERLEAELDVCQSNARAKGSTGDLLFEFLQAMKTGNKLPNIRLRGGPYTREVLRPLAQSSAYGERLYMSLLLSIRGVSELNSDNYVGFVKSFADAYRLSELPVVWRESDSKKVTFACSQLAADPTQTNQVRGDALLVHAFLRFSNKDLIRAVQDLRAAQRFLPLDDKLLTVEACVHATMSDISSALAALDRASELGSTDIESTLFTRGCLLQQLEDGASSLKDPSEAKRCLEMFIDKASPEDRKVCEAHYHLAVINFLEIDNNFALENLRLGVAAEARRLRCFDAPKSSWRLAAELMASRVRSRAGTC